MLPGVGCSELCRDQAPKSAYTPAGKHLKQFTSPGCASRLPALLPHRQPHVVCHAPLRSTFPGPTVTTWRVPVQDDATYNSGEAAAGDGTTTGGSAAAAAAGGVEGEEDPEDDDDEEGRAEGLGGASSAARRARKSARYAGRCACTSARANAVTSAADEPLRRAASNSRRFRPSMARLAIAASGLAAASRT